MLNPFPPILKFLKNNFVPVFLVIIIIAVLPLSYFVYNVQRYDSNLQPKTIIVLGAGIINNSVPGNILRNRLDKAIELVQSKPEIKYIIVSGDNRSSDYNEPEVMKKYLEKNLVKTNSKVKIIPDYGGLRTIDTCYRAKNYFGVNSSYIVSQGFHLPRTKFVCNSVGLSVIPLTANDSNIGTTVWGYFREVFASWVSVKESIGYQPAIKGDGSELRLE